MEGEAPFKREAGKSRRSRLFSRWLDGYHGISQGPKSRLGKAEYEEGEEYVEEEESKETEAAAAFSGAPEAPEAPNLALSDQPLVSQA
ncbi:hypothetical protein O181_022564 [Austropuccinia psidii MF-1]|uniref:Uncharacterized protein n=1 Tax=Austropuccinia psidii MF-1 TaxID=1389203 RepID=A0A9Q3CCU4_9BASI|nr:hypothetical protein [Austropuccinia psidii MF-1]